MKTDRLSARGRVLSIGDLSSLEGTPRPFAMMVYFDELDTPELEQLLSSVPTLVAEGCTEFACAGAVTEEVHDLIDDVLVDRYLNGVVTSFFSDESFDEVCFYFLICAGAPRGLLALLAGEPELATILREMFFNPEGHDLP